MPNKPITVFDFEPSELAKQLSLLDMDLVIVRVPIVDPICASDAFLSSSHKF